VHMKRNPEATCATCSFVYKDHLRMPKRRVLRCRRFPASTSDNGWGTVSAHLTVENGDWCGEHPDFDLTDVNESNHVSPIKQLCLMESGGYLCGLRSGHGGAHSWSRER